MVNTQYPASRTSNDISFDLDRQSSEKSSNYDIVVQSVEEVQNIQNAPAVSMGPYLIESGQTQLLTTVSIYSQPGDHRDQSI